MVARGLLLHVWYYPVTHFKSVVDIKPGDSSMVIACYADEFPYTWVVEFFLSEIYPDSCASCQL